MASHGNEQATTYQQTKPIVNIVQILSSIVKEAKMDTLIKFGQLSGIYKYQPK